MIIDHLNLNHLRVFEAVYETRSMTAAARRLHLTQSGVSQHIRSLEDVLEVKLFDRVKQRLVPTALGTRLYRECSQGLAEIEAALSHVKGGGEVLSGTVAVGVPIEFGNNMILPLISQFSRKHSQVKFQIKMGLASEMNRLLLRGELDFAFVDNFRMDQRIRVERVYDEIIELCISKQLIKDESEPEATRKFFESLPYVAYDKGEPVLRMWLEHHMGHRNYHLDVKAAVMDVVGVSRLVVGGVGAGALPGHQFRKLQKEGAELVRFEGCGKPLKNTISVASLQDRTQSFAAQEVFKVLKNSLAQQASLNS